MDDMMNGAGLVRVLYGPLILRWTKPLRGRFHEVSIGNCQQRTGPYPTHINTSRSFI
jgi:hypothetical protein